jgi:PAS domain S-box-containing protein
MSESDYRQMIDSVSEISIIKLDPAGIVQSWNRGAEQLKGYRAEEIVGKSIAAVYPPEEAHGDALARELAEASAKGRLEVEGWRLRKNGERFWANVVLQPMRGSGGELSGYVKVVRDLSERKKAEERFRSIIEAVPNALLMVDREGRITMTNAQAEKLFGYRREELVGQRIEMLVPPRIQPIHPDMRAGFFRDPKTRPMGAGRDLFGLTKDGREVPVEIGLNPIETDEGRFVLASIIDITERKRAEDLVRKQRDEILELSTPVMQVWDKVLALPIIGTLDSNRAQRLTENLLQKIADEEASIVILDISGVPSVDSQVAQHLIKTIDGARLMGAESIISGVRPETAQAMVHLGINIGGIRSRATLRDALQLALKLRQQAEASDFAGGRN